MDLPTPTSVSYRGTPIGVGTGTTRTRTVHRRPEIPLVARVLLLPFLILFCIAVWAFMALMLFPFFLFPIIVLPPVGFSTWIAFSLALPIRVFAAVMIRGDMP